MAAMVEEIDYEGLDHESMAINMLAGAMAGISEHAVMYPVDSIKVSYSSSSLPTFSATRQQLTPSRSPCAAISQTRMQVLSTSPAAVYNNMSEAFTRISSTEGTRRLWRGVASVIWGAGPAHAVYFGTYELAKELAGGNSNGYSFVATGECYLLMSSVLSCFDGS